MAAARDPHRSRDLIDGLLAAMRADGCFTGNEYDAAAERRRQEAVRAAQAAFARIDWELTDDGQVRPGGAIALSTATDRPALDEQLDTSQPGGEDVRQIPQSSWTIARTANELRKLQGTGHGRTLPTGVSAEMALLVVREACSVAHRWIAAMRSAAPAHNARNDNAHIVERHDSRTAVGRRFEGPPAHGATRMSGLQRARAVRGRRA